MFFRLTTSTTRALHCSDHVPMLWSLPCFGFTLRPAAVRSMSEEEEEVQQQERMAVMAKNDEKDAGTGFGSTRKTIRGFVICWRLIARKRGSIQNVRTQCRSGTVALSSRFALDIWSVMQHEAVLDEQQDSRQNDVEQEPSEAARLHGQYTFFTGGFE